MWTGSPQGRLQWDQTVLGAPLIGPLVMKIETARFARTLGTMLKSGVPVMSALAVVGDTMTNQAIGQAVARLSDGVKRGGTIAAGMQEQAPFPVLAIHMVRVGEETGRLEDMLIKVAETFEHEVGTDLKRVLRLLEPVIIFGMGVLVAGTGLVELSFRRSSAPDRLASESIRNWPETTTFSPPVRPSRISV